MQRTRVNPALKRLVFPFFWVRFCNDIKKRKISDLRRMNQRGKKVDVLGEPF